MRTLRDIIEASGGAKGIEAASSGTINRDAVYKWPTIGVPDRHWDVLIRLCGTTPEELYEANRAARSVPSQSERSAASNSHDLPQDADRVSLAGAGADLASAPALSCQVPAVCDSDLAFSNFMGATGAPDADAPVSKQEAAE